ncbi:MAG: leucine-rich repeat domain-containing protein [Treponema sp.]|jgi:hypothetical protein|nr:leucine-rich repeat domain-containing protein [Treponema sp.]
MKMSYLIGIASLVIATAVTVTACSGKKDSGNSGGGESSVAATNEGGDESSMEEASDKEVKYYLRGGRFKGDQTIAQIIELIQNGEIDGGAEVSNFDLGIDAPLAIIPELAQELDKAGIQESDFTVEITTDGKGIVITDYTGRPVNITIPATIEGFPVLAIGENAFIRSGITSVVIPEGVIELMPGAFSYNPLLTSVTLPNSLKRIGGSTFNTTGYAIQHGNVVETGGSVGNGAFESSGITSIKIPANTIVEQSAFYQCTSLKTITLGNNVTLEHTVFNSCSSLETVIVEGTLRGNFSNSAGSGAATFGQCEKLSLASQKTLRDIGYKNSF